jgi:hypothetical protein
MGGGRFRESERGDRTVNIREYICYDEEDDDYNHQCHPPTPVVPVRVAGIYIAARSHFVSDEAGLWVGDEMARTREQMTQIYGDGRESHTIVHYRYSVSCLRNCGERL